jgi:hypothetical protein
MVQMSKRLTVASPGVTSGLLTAGDALTSSCVPLRATHKSLPGPSQVQIVVGEKSGAVCKPMIAGQMPRSGLPFDCSKLNIVTSSSVDGFQIQPLELKSGRSFIFCLNAVK